MTLRERLEKVNKYLLFYITTMKISVYGIACEKI